MPSRARRVLIVVENLPVPFDRRVWLEATTLARHGDRVSVICPKAKGFTRSHEVIEDVEIFRYPVPVNASGPLGFAIEFIWCFAATALISLYIATRGRGFDVLHACNPPDTFWLLGRFWKLFGKRYIFDHHDLSAEMFAVKFNRSSGALYRGLLWLERQSMLAADVVITTNESHKAIAVARGGKHAEDVIVVRSGPDLARLPVLPADPAYRAGKAHLLVYLGEICKQDGVDFMVRAVKLLAEQHGRTDFRALFVGGGPHQPAIKAYAEAEGIMAYAAFTGRVSDGELCRILSSATIGIDPDPKNPWSDKSTMNKVIEYMHFGLPVVAFDLHETRVSAAEAGVYAKANSEADLAATISALLDAPDRMAAMAEAGRARVRDVLAWNHSVAPLLRAYDRAMAPQEARSAVVSGETGSEVTRAAGVK
jgi:glycosyltransferase involved in cell wall biosynthesis